MTGNGSALSFVDAPGLEWADDDAPSISALSFDSGTRALRACAWK